MFRNNECDPNDLPSKYIPNDGSLEAFMIPKTPEPSEGTSSNQVSNGNSFDALAAMLQNDQHKMQDHAAISSRSHSGQNGDPIVIQDDQHQTNGDATPSPYNQSIYFLPTQTPQKMRHDLAHNNFTVYGSQVPPPKHAFAPRTIVPQCSLSIHTLCAISQRYILRLLHMLLRTINPRCIKRPHLSRHTTPPRGP